MQSWGYKNDNATEAKKIEAIKRSRSSPLEVILTKFLGNSVFFTSVATDADADADADADILLRSKKFLFVNKSIFETKKLR